MDVPITVYVSVIDEDTCDPICQFFRDHYMYCHLFNVDLQSITIEFGKRENYSWENSKVIPKRCNGCKGSDLTKYTDGGSKLRSYIEKLTADHNKAELEKKKAKDKEAIEEYDRAVKTLNKWMYVGNDDRYYNRLIPSIIEELSTVDKIVEFLDDHRRIFSAAIIDHIEKCIESKQQEQTFM